MSDVTRDKMARGTKLMAGHVFGSAAPKNGLLGISDDMISSEISAENLHANLSTFNVHLTWPYIDSEICNFHAGDDVLNPTGTPGGVCAPFLLPPLQNYFDVDEPPTVVLEDIVYSFDQRSEGCVTSSKWQGVTDSGGAVPASFADFSSGNMNFEQNPRLDVNIVIYEKTPIIDRDDTNPVYARYVCQHENYQPHWLPDQVVFEVSVSGTPAFNVGAARSNPYTIRNISRRINPHKSYMVALIYPNLAIADPAPALPRADFAIVNVQLVLKFTHPLVQAGWRDAVPSGTIPQNAPNIRGSRLGPSGNLPTTSPAAGTVVETEGSDGINTAFTQLDRELRTKLLGGLGRNCRAPGHEALGVDSSYDVIMVPVFQNPYNGMIKNKTPSEGVAHAGVVNGEFFGSPEQMPLHDGNLSAVASRRVVSLPFPFEIHHAFACINWQKAEQVSSDTLPAITHDIGVIMGTGMIGDHVAHDQVALGEIDQKWGDVGGVPVTPFLIDRWTYPFHRTVLPDGPFDGTTLNHNVSWEIYQIPLTISALGAADPAKVWASPSGTPVFMGPGMGASSGVIPWPVEGNSRTDLAAGYAGCAGGEQWIEVRWAMTAKDALAQAPGPGWTNLTANQTIIGYQGMYVILCGRRFLTDGR